LRPTEYFSDSPEGYITEANQAVCELFGMDKKNMMQLHKMPFTKESLERYPMRFDLLKQGKTVISERVIKRKDGSEIMIEMKTKMMDDGSYQSIYRDITERKQNENALKENEEKFRTIFEESNDAIYLMDGDTFIDCNEQAVKMFECADRNEMINHKPMEFSPSVQPDGSESVPSALEHINEALAGRQQRFYWKHRKKNGQDFDAEVSLNAVFLKGKKFLQAIVKDITFRMEAEKEIKQINESLEQKIKERTAELEEAYKELESFSYSVSHDLRAPLRHISGFSDITRKNLSSGNIEKASNSLKKVEEATEKMEKLIDGLLKLSRTGRVELNMTELNMNGIIADVIDEYKDCPEYNAAEWHIRELPSVYADRTLMTSVWENLIDNALKYTGKNDDPKIEIGCNNSADRCEFYIKDNGVGFDPEFTNKLFGVFQRLHLDKEFRGTGIGLATVKRIIDRHGGTVRAEGETNKGATFYFTLPKVQGEK